MMNGYANGTTFVFSIMGNKLAKLVKGGVENPVFCEYPAGTYALIMKVYSRDDPKCEGKELRSKTSHIRIEKDKTTKVECIEWHGKLLSVVAYVKDSI